MTPKVEKPYLVQVLIDPYPDSSRDLVALDSKGRIWARLSRPGATTDAWVSQWIEIEGPML